MITVHELKCYPRYFQAILEGKKTFEIRRCHDRDFKVGDELVLKEYDPGGLETGSRQAYTGNEIKVTVSYVLKDPDYVKHGYAVMSIKRRPVNGTPA